MLGIGSLLPVGGISLFTSANRWSLRLRELEQSIAGAKQALAHIPVVFQAQLVQRFGVVGFELLRDLCMTSLQPGRCYT